MQFAGEIDSVPVCVCFHALLLLQERKRVVGFVVVLYNALLRCVLVSERVRVLSLTIGLFFNFARFVVLSLSLAGANQVALRLRKTSQGKKLVLAFVFPKFN